MVSRSTALVVFISALHGAAQDPGAGSMTHVFVYRYKQFVGAALEPSVYCDEVQLARMDNGRYFVVSIPPGKHVFRSNDSQAGAELDTVVGKDYYIRVELATGMWKGHGRLVVTPSEQGAYEIRKLQLLDSDKIKDKSRVLATGVTRDPKLDVRPPTTMTNKDIVALKKAGLGDELIIAQIKASPSEFSLGTEDLVTLKTSDVSDAVISEMMVAAKRK